jgi:hypothetical protein
VVGGGHMAHMGVRTLPRRAKGRLCPGLDGTLSAAAAGSVKQPARDLITERLALESDRCSGDESRHRRTAVTRRHGAPQPTRWLMGQAHTRTPLWRGSGSGA